MNRADPVDIVYLWCNGQDPAFIRQKKERMQALNLPWNEENLGDLRYFDNEELRYSLRSVCQNMPWVNHIYIVTNNQRPTWLKNDPKVTVVDHREIIPESLLPTFNSVTIEMHLHKIPQLSEKYILFNDDFFIGTPLEKDFFFCDDKPIVRLREWKIASSLKEAEQLLNSDKISDFAKTQLRAWTLVAEQYGLEHPYRLSHCPDAYTKTAISKVLDKHTQLTETNASPFRSDNDIQRVIFQLEMAFGQGSPLRKVRNPNFFEKYIYWPGNKHYECFGGSESSQLLDRLRRFKPMMFYINAGVKNNISEKEMTKDYLQEIFPTPSPFEVTA